jgi:hypothetical protein
MPRIEYVPRSFTPASQAVITQANQIITVYLAQGFKLTLRQLYYQFVARALIPNNIRSYKRLGSVINDARLAGLIDWDAIEDRTREVKMVSHWEQPSDIIESAAQSFRLDKWSDQEYRPEVWIEKEALAGVISGVCRELDIPYLSCRGYASQSEMWASARRMKMHLDDGQKPVLLHFGDHDPSGMDMTEDIRNRMRIFECEEVEIRRIALNMNQVEQYNPPPNPAKDTDARFDKYKDEYGDECWELDALEPSVLVDLIREQVLNLRDEDLWAERAKKEREYRELLARTSARWRELGDLFGLLLQKPKKDK